VNQLFVKGLVIAFGLVAAIIVIGINLGDVAVRSGDPALIARTASFSPHAAAMAAEANLVSGHYDQAESLARRALKNAPMSAQALRVLGLSRQAQGHEEQAAQIMSLAAGLGWRDTPTQIWLIQAYFAQGDIGAALERASGLARRNEYLDRMMQIFIAAAGAPEAHQAVEDRLVTNPPWRQAFFNGWRKLPVEQSATYIAFLDKFTRAHGPLAPQETEPFVSGLFSRGHYRLARDAWQRFGPAGDMLLTDGGFAAAERGRGPFQWNFPPKTGIDTMLGSPPSDAKERALYVKSDGYTRADVARQSVVLDPGSYIVSMDVMEEGGAEPHGFNPALFCLPGQRNIALTRSSARKQGRWIRMMYNFDVPAFGCEAQLFVIGLRGFQPRAFTLWFDNLEIRRSAG
jgi:hypothetical protein